MKIIWNKVTWYSRLAALVVFGGAVVWGFWMGNQYQYAVGECLTSLDRMTTLVENINGVPRHCGGLVRNAPTCPANYHCVLGKVVDLGGVCVRN